MLPENLRGKGPRGLKLGGKTNPSGDFMKREELITQIFLALVASNEIKIGYSKAAKQVQEHLDLLESIQQELTPAQAARRTLGKKRDTNKLA